MPPAIYLLGSQALVDSARNERTAIHDWAERENLLDTDVCASVISFTIFRTAVDESPVNERTAWQRAFSETLTRFRRQPGNLRPVSAEIAVRAGELRAMTLTSRDGSDVGPLRRLVVATALEERLTLVERREPWHRLLERQHGLRLHDPES